MGDPLETLKNFRKKSHAEKIKKGALSSPVLEMHAEVSG